MTDDAEKSVISIPKSAFRQVATILGIFGVVGSASFGACRQYFDTMHRLEALEKRAESYVSQQRVNDDIEKAKVEMDIRLDKIERWKCVLGWDPGGVSGPSTRNSDRVCVEED